MNANFDLTIEKAKRTVPDGVSNRTVFYCNKLIVKQGARLGIKGESGAGKTTFLKLISGVITPQSGKILWGKEDLGLLKDEARDIWRGENLGLVFQDFRLFPGLTALENVLLPFSFRQRIDRELKETAAQLLGRFNLRAQTYSELLSRGEMQRVAIVRTLLQKPKVILADEPTASLDAENAQLVMSTLMGVVEELGATLIMVSHDSRVIQQFSHVADLNKGVLEDGIFK